MGLNKSVIFFITLSILNVMVSPQIHLTISHCCSIGINHGKEDLDCGQYNNPVTGISPEEEDICRSTIKLCCSSLQNDDLCGKGVDLARSTNSCPSQNDLDTCTSTERLCCEACLLGKKYREANGTCHSSKIQTGYDVLFVFEACCRDSAPLESINDKKSNYASKNSDPPLDYDYEDNTVTVPPVNDICQRMPSQLCAHICISTPGSYYCKCREGYTLMEDQKTCQLNKVKGKIPVPTSPNSNIVPNPERPVPLHKPRYNTTQPSYEDKSIAQETSTSDPLTTTKRADSCQVHNPCEQECNDTSGYVKCSCNPGYELDLDQVSCTDKDECLDNTHVCDPGLEVCINERGGYRCSERKVTQPETRTIVMETTPSPHQTPNCHDGYKIVLNYKGEVRGCEDVNECASQVCDSNQICLNIPGSYECRCTTGYTLDPVTKACVDINECQTNRHNCLPTQRCDNTFGSYQCIRFTSCGTGYTLNAHSGQCEDDDECLLGTDNCRFLGANYACRNTPGSFRCVKKRCLPGEVNCSRYCPKGFNENNAGQCMDINECTTGTHNCHHQQQCINVIGGFECKTIQYSCPNGFESTSTGCVDIDECGTNTHTCKGFAQCRNHNGGYTCTCPPGYERNEENDCIDIDECKLYSCQFDAECQNTVGSYRCICKAGFRNVDNNNCADINECVENQGICQHNCINVFGSYRCTCNSGFVLHENNRSCTDLDECEIFKDQRLCLGECVNVPGSFTCRCPQGYKLGNDGRSCQDIDECVNNPCRDEDEVCTNTRGSYRCNSIKCPAGYIKDTEHMNRCKRSKTMCREGDTSCFYQPLTYSFNFITFVSMLPIPPTGHLDLFTLRGPLWSGADAHFKLNFVSTRSPPEVKESTSDDFKLRNTGWNQAAIALIKPIQGPQELELQLVMNLYQYGSFSGIAVAKLFIHVSQYEF